MNKILTLLSGFALMLAAEAGHSYTVYNNSGDTVKVWGEHCIPCMAVTLNPGASASCPGDNDGCRGDTTISFIDLDDDSFSDDCYKATAKVTNHGWVVITGSDGFFDAAVFDNGGQQRNANNTGIKPTRYDFEC